MHPYTTDYRIAGPISNYELYPEYGLVYAYVNIGETGNHFVKYLMRWEGTDLVLFRRAEGAIYEWYAEQDGRPCKIQYWDRVNVSVLDYTQDEWGDVLYSEVLRLDEMTEEKHQQIDDALWQGIK